MPVPFARPRLSVRLDDIWGRPIRWLSQYSDLEVVDPLMDSRTAKLTLSLSNPIIRDVTPMKVITITYGLALVFRGYVILPEKHYKDNTLEVNCIDPTIRLKHHYHRYGDYAVDVGYPLDGTGFRILVESSVPWEAQLDRTIPPNGILWGGDTSTPQGPKPNSVPADPGDGLWRRAERGAEVWQTLQDAAQVIGAPDFRFRPVDDEHPGVTEAPLPPGALVEFDTADRIGLDKTVSVHFQHNFGKDNAEDLIIGPDANAIRNYWVSVYPGGERHRGDDRAKAMAHDEASYQAYGMFMGWESSGQRDSKEALQAKADAYVDAYAEPPEFFTVVPRMDRHGVPVYGDDFFTGDTIKAEAKRGFAQDSVEGRIVTTRLTQADANSNTRVSFDCVPHIDATPESGENEGGLN